MFLKRRTRTKDGKTHVYYSVCESLRVSRDRVVQRQLLHLGELNTTQLDSWQHSLDVLHEDGQRRQLRLFTDREQAAPNDPDVVEVKLSSFAVKSPRRFGDGWAATQLWEDLGLRAFWQGALADTPGDVPWHKVLELLVINRLLAPRSELFVHEKWFPQTALEGLLDTDARVADKDRLYRCLDRVLAHKPTLEPHLAAKWKDLFGATFDLLLYDLTSTCFEGDVEAVPQARRGYSRDHRPDCKQLVLALIVTPEGFPLTYEVFPGNRLDRTTLQDILDTNLEGTPKSRLKAYEEKLLAGDWHQVSAQVQVQLLPAAGEVYGLCRSTGRGQKERAMRRRWRRRLLGDLRRLRRRVRAGPLKQRALIQRTLGRLQERHRQAWRWLKWELQETAAGLAFDGDWDREKFQARAGRRGVSLARPLAGGRAGQTMADLRATGRGRGGVPHLEERNQSAPDLALDRASRRSARANGVPGLLACGSA
jgi:hypothetical protein